MLAFGLGTLPSMVTATIAFEKIARSLASRATLRNIAGALLLAFGLWTAGQAVYSGFMRGAQGQHGEHRHH
jgi:sulfite exporter TauE/SafE